MMKKCLSALMLLMSACFAAAMPSFAKIRQISKDNYEISSADDYEEFRQIVATGNPYANAVLTSDITVNDVIGKGDVQFHYRGTFDGQGHTITMNSVRNNTKNKPWGLFQYTEPGCVIKNLKVVGSLINENEGATMGSFVGEARGTRIENCISDATLNGYGYVGGLVGTCYGANFFENCAFIGECTAGNSEQYGIVGYNAHTISIKSCYVDAVFISTTSAPFCNETNKDNCVFMNNYYRITGVQGVESTYSGATKVSEDDIKLGKLCCELNVKGRNGVVWYQHGDHPHPFKADGDKVASFNVSGYVLATSCANTNYDGHICTHCGEIQKDNVGNPYKVDPLQTVSDGGENGTYIDLLRYKFNSTNETAAVTGVKNNKIVNAIHIPETVRLNGRDYTVTTINGYTFASPDEKTSAMQYCYIPKTVTLIEDNAFNYCNSLTDLHIADCPSNGEARVQKLYMSLNKRKYENEDLFFDCPLEKVYIGRDLRWDTSTNIFNIEGPDEPFEAQNKITDVVFGPRVSRVGNYLEEDARKGYSYDLFNDCTGVRRVYILGDEKSMDEDYMYFYIRDGLTKATDFYINRNIGSTGTGDDNYWGYTAGSYNDMGCLDRCEHVTYGPFVQYITKESFKGLSTNNNTTLKTVDFTNAINLETIDENAFAYCHETSFGADPFKNCTKLKEIGFKAFTDCDGIKKLFLPASVEKLYSQAFDDCDKLTSLLIEDSTTPITFIDDNDDGGAFNSCDVLVNVYQGRDYVLRNNKSPFSSCSKLATVLVGPSVTHLTDNSYADLEKLNAFTFLASGTPLKIDNLSNVVGSAEVTMLFINRKLVNMDNKENVNWGDTIKSTVLELSFGETIDHVYENLFNGFTALKTLTIPSNINNVQMHAFDKCSALETLCILGKTTVYQYAFAHCPNLHYVYLTNKDILLDSRVFDESDNIQEVYTAFESNPTVQSSDYAFPQNVYETANLVCAGDMGYKKIELTSVPWSNFKNREFPTDMKTNDYEGDYMTAEQQEGDFDHASISHSFKEKQMELVYFPFDMDSYYFGSDAEIYQLKINEKNYSDNCESTDGHKVADVIFEKVNIDDVKNLSYNAYVVKTARNEESMASHLNLFNANSIAVKNALWQLQGVHSGADLKAGNAISSLNASSNAFVCQDGMLMLVNGNYNVGDGDVVLYGNAEDGELMAFNIVDGESNVLMSSKLNLSFNEHLEGYSSFYAADCNYIAPEWCDVYVATSGASGAIKLEKIEDHVITKGQAVLLHSSNSASDGLTEYLTHATHGSSATALYAQNMLKGVSEDTEVSELCGADGFVYVLSCNSSYKNTGFYKLSSSKVMPAGKAYLLPDANSDAKSCLFVCDEAATGIIRTESEGMKMIYDLMGRRLKETGSKGIYIIDNKKVLK